MSCTLLISEVAPETDFGKRSIPYSRKISWIFWGELGGFWGSDRNSRRIWKDVGRWGKLGVWRVQLHNDLLNLRRGRSSPHPVGFPESKASRYRETRVSRSHRISIWIRPTIKITQIGSNKASLNSTCGEFRIVLNVWNRGKHSNFRAERLLDSKTLPLWSFEATNCCTKSRDLIATRIFGLSDFPFRRFPEFSSGILQMIQEEYHVDSCLQIE